MISKELSATLGAAVREAKKRRHEYVCVEHVLYAILNQETGFETVEKCGGDPEIIKKNLNTFFQEKMTVMSEGEEYVLQQTIGFQRMIQRAINHARSSEKNQVSIGDIIASIFQEKDSHAAYFLEAEGITRLDILNYISHGAGLPPKTATPGKPDQDFFDLENNQKNQVNPTPCPFLRPILLKRQAWGKLILL